MTHLPQATYLTSAIQASGLKRHRRIHTKLYDALSLVVHPTLLTVQSTSQEVCSEKDQQEPSSHGSESQSIGSPPVAALSTQPERHWATQDCRPVEYRSYQNLQYSLLNSNIGNPRGQSEHLQLFTPPEMVTSYPVDSMPRDPRFMSRATNVDTISHTNAAPLDSHSSHLFTEEDPRTLGAFLWQTPGI